MKALAQRVWNEPAVAIGLLTSVLLALITWVGGDDWTVETIIAVVAPFLSAIGIRQLVSPVRPAPEPGTTYQPGEGGP